MPRRSEVAKLPPEVRRWLERSLEEAGYGGYELLVGLLQEKGFSISKSALHRWGQDIAAHRSAVNARIKLQTDMALALTDANQDDRLTRMDAINALIETDMLDHLVKLSDAQEEADPAERVLFMAKVGKEFATMGRSSIELKRWQASLREAARRELLNEQKANLEKIAKSQGMSQEQLDFWIKDFLGVR